MATLAVHNVTKQFGPQVVLDGVSFQVHTNEVVGLVGANGTGKTTIFRLIAGGMEPDMGSIAGSKNLQIGYLKQEPELSEGNTLHDEVGSVFNDLLAMEQRLHDLSAQMGAAHEQGRLDELMADYEKINERFIAAGGYEFETRLKEILGGLGFTLADYELPINVLSGGQKCRAALAKLLLRDHQLLLLDEPTNHLDIDAVRWLEKFLAGHHGGAIVISHDRYLLDRLADRIIELDRRQATTFTGNYSTYVQTRQLRLLSQARQFVKDKEYIEKEKAFIAKHMAGQRTKEAQGRRKRLERRLASGEFVLEKPSANHTAGISFGGSGKKQRSDRGKQQGPRVVRAEDLSMAFGDKTLFTDLNFQVDGGDRFGITGPNGTGKSTLLKILLGQHTPIAGEFTIEPKLQIGYYDQEHVDLNPDHNVVQEITENSELDEAAARSYLARFLFKGDDVFKPVSRLSGGEQSRVRLAKLILESPDMLILDEPTNHLDIPSREALEEALDEFDGTIITVSHDRYFLDRIVDRLMVMRPAGVRLVTGNYSDYIAEIEKEQAEEASGAGKASKKSGKKSRKRGGNGQALSPEEREDEERRQRVAQYDHLGVDQIEAMIMQHEEKLADLQNRYADPDVLKDADALEELKEEIELTVGELADLEAAWEQRADAV